MKLTVIYGQSHRGVTYTMTRAVLDKLMAEGDELTEFFLPKDGPDFCVGCNSCFLRGEAHCPEAERVQPIMRAVEDADILMLASPNYCMEMSGAMKNLLDHFAYRWVTHRPHPSMFGKVGLVLSSSAGVPPLGTVKSLARQLRWLCVPTVYRFPFVSSAMTVADLSEKKRRELDRKAETLARKLRRAAERRHVGLRTRLSFLLFRGMQKGESTWNPTDRDWWVEQGWLAGKKPWESLR